MLQKLVGEIDDQDQSHLFDYLEGPHCFAAATSFVFDCQLWRSAVGLFFGLAGMGDHVRWCCDGGLGLARIRSPTEESPPAMLLVVWRLSNGSDGVILL
jgi:hypothetical protein